MLSIHVRAGVVALGVSLVTAGLHAHHSFPAFYFEDQSITIEGSVVEFDYRAPHAWVRVMAPDPDGQMRTYGAEWSNPARLARDKVTKDSLKPGDVVRITGSPGRKSDDFVLHLKRIERPRDRWVWQARPRR
jgi:hypothetical protein